MRKMQYSAAELELAAEEILEELEGWERTAQQKQETADVSRAERFLQMITSVAEQAGSARREEPTKMQQSPAEAQFAEVVNPRNLSLHTSTEAISEPSAPLEQDQIDAFSEVPLSDRSGKLRSRMQNRTEGVSRIPAEEAATAWQRTLFIQSQLSAISDWIERDSRRYDSGFSIL